MQIGRGSGWANSRKENLRLTIVQFSIFLVLLYLGGQLPTQTTKLLSPFKEQQESLRLLFQRNAHGSKLTSMQSKLCFICSFLFLLYFQTCNIIEFLFNFYKRSRSIKIDRNMMEQCKTILSF